MDKTIKLAKTDKDSLNEGDIIFFEYEHNYNSRSRAMRYKRGYYLGDGHGKAILILQSLHGSWNSSTTICDYDRVFVESYIGLVEVKKRKHFAKNNKGGEDLI